MQDLNSLINKAIYYWDWYLIKGEKDYLVAAWQFMLDYRKLGGTEYKETENAIHAHVKEFEKTVNQVAADSNKKIKEIKNEILGMSWDELEQKQGGRLTRDN